jgi:hypothetical protein
MCFLTFFAVTAERRLDESVGVPATAGAAVSASAPAAAAAAVAARRNECINPSSRIRAAPHPDGAIRVGGAD